MSATPPPPIICPDALNADLVSEPLPPDGFDQDKLAGAFMAAFGPELGTAVWKWFRSDWPAWGRDAARAREKGHEWCKNPTRAQPPP